MLITIYSPVVWNIGMLLSVYTDIPQRFTKGLWWEEMTVKPVIHDHSTIDVVCEYMSVLGPF